MNVREENLHVKYADSEHCQNDGEPWPCLVSRLLEERHSTNAALSDAVEALAKAKLSAELAEEDYRRMVGAASRLEKTSRARIAELEAATSRDAVLVEVAVWLGKKAREYRSTGSRQHALQAETLEQMASKIRRGAVRPEVAPQRQAEDPHNGPLASRYAVPRDLPAIPHQTTGRCPRCTGTFEDCTCGGTPR